MDAPLSPSGLFGDAVDSVVERFQESAKQAAAFQKLLPRRIHISGAAEREIKIPPPLKVERLTPNFMVPVSLRCPQGTSLPTLPPCVLQRSLASASLKVHLET